MRRREFIALLGGAATWPLAARGQGTKVPRIGILDFFPSTVSAEFMEPFQEGLRELGYVDGQNIHVEYHSAEQQHDRATALAAEFVRREIDIIVALATPAAHAVKSATTTIPIVMSVADPVSTGLAASLARPGANLTGVTSTSADLAGKRLELLRELHPSAVRIAFLGAANDPNTVTFVEATQAAAETIGVRVHPLLVTGPQEFETAFAKMVRERTDGLIVQPLFVGHRARLAELALQNRLPLIADQSQFVTSGALATYGINRDILFRRLAYYIDRILKGAKPADLPIEQPTIFHLTINLKTAKALGLDVPSTLLARADEVIE
jgi:putative tryptophan/tyrosine transport system substrate-binding protein